MKFIWHRNFKINRFGHFWFILEDACYLIIWSSGGNLNFPVLKRRLTFVAVVLICLILEFEIWKKNLTTPDSNIPLNETLRDWRIESRNKQRNSLEKLSTFGFVLILEIYPRKSQISQLDSDFRWSFKILAPKQ